MVVTKKHKSTVKAQKVKEILPAHLRTKTQRLKHIQAKLDEPLSKEEKKKEAQLVTRQCKQDVWNWNTALDKAAFYMAEGRLSLIEIKKKTGISTNKIKKMMLLQGEFYSRVEHYREAWMRKFVATGFGNRNTRLQVYEDLGEKILDIVKSRQRKYINRKHPGVDTGLMVRTVKAVGHGAKTKIVRGWDFDKELVKELKDTMVLIAKEKGDWAEKNINENTVLVREYGGASPADV